MDGILTRRFCIPASAVAVIGAFFAWFALASRSGPEVIAPPHAVIATGAQADLYPLLARGFLHGHLYLDAVVPPALAGAPDPYGVSGLSAPHLHDASLYHGRYYLYFGPAPALALFLPFRLLTGHDLTAAAAVIVFCILAYAGMVALFTAAAGSEFSWRPGFRAAAILLTLAGASLLLPLLRRPAVYEVAIAGGSAFFLWSLVCVFRPSETARPARWAALAGVLLGLAAASRPTYVLGFFPLAGGILGLNRSRPVSDRRADLACAAAGFGAIIALLLLYNFMRFGAPFEFGQKYQLSGTREGDIRHFSLALLPYQARAYLFQPLALSRYFPFVHPIAPPAPPPGIGGYEYVFGLLPSLPVVLFAAVAVFRPGPRARSTALILGGAAAVMLVPVLLYFGTCVRYMADFAPALAVLACLGMAAPGRWRAGLACAAAAAGFAAVFFACVDMYDMTPATPPPALDRLGNAFDRPVVRWDEFRGVRFGPRQLAFALPANRNAVETVIAARGPRGERDALAVERTGPNAVRFFFLRDTRQPLEQSPFIGADSSRAHRLTVSLGGLYPLRPGEMADSLPPRVFAALRIWLHLELDGAVIWEAPIAPRPERLDEVTIGRVAQEAKVLPPSAVRLARPHLGGIALGLNLTPAMTGRSFPLAASGRAGAGNILLVLVETPERIRFGYDHWGKPTLGSSPVSTAGPGLHRIEFWMPSILNASPARPLEVACDGRTAWVEDVPYFTANRDEMFVARNPLGGTGCEARLVDYVVEDLNLPEPSGHR